MKKEETPQKTGTHWLLIRSSALFAASCKMVLVQGTTSISIRCPAKTHQLHAIAEAAGIELARLPRAKSSPEKVLLAALPKNVAPVSNGWLGVRLAMGDASSVISLVTRFHRQGLDHTAGFQALHSQFAT